MQPLGKDLRDYLALLGMTRSRNMARVVRIAKPGELDDRAERTEYWATRSIEERILEVERLRRMWPELTGDADQPIARVAQKRPLAR